MKIDQIYYTPQQLASFFSIKKDTLLYYDRIGLFSPIARRENGYRCYSAAQLSELDTILTLKELGIPLSSIKESIDRISAPSFVSLLENEERSLSKRIDECRALLDTVVSIRTSISEAQQAEDAHISQALQAGMQSSLGQVPGITSDALYSSATKQALVGGDFYTLIRLPDDRAVMILGDVSGKGVEAASMSALVKTALTAYAWEGASPQHMVRSLNSMLMSFSRVETFATMFVAKLDLRHGSALYCSAGHPPSMLLRRRPLGADPAATEATEIELLSTQSGVVGAFEGMAFRTGSFRFAPGDVLFMYTDGAIEARNAAGEFFGEQRLRDVLLASIGSGVHGLCQRVLDELDSFTDSALEDDIAMVALRFDTGVETVRPPGAAARRAA